MSNRSPKRREPGKRVFPKPKPQLTLIKSERKSGPSVEMSPEVKEMLREMNRRQRQSDSDTPDAA